MELWKDIVFWFVVGIMCFIVLGCFALVFNDVKKDLTKSRRKKRPSVRVVTARKPHVCGGCYRIIKKGEKCIFRYSETEKWFWHKDCFYKWHIVFKAKNNEGDYMENEIVELPKHSHELAKSTET